MLILTRRIGETLRIGDDVSLMVVGVQGNQVRIGADAPKSVAIHREEIYRRIQQEKNGEPVTPPKPKPQANQYQSPSSPPPSRAYNTQNSYNSPSHNSNSGNRFDSETNEGTRFYSTEGSKMGAPSKTPNVIVKKRKTIESV